MGRREGERGKKQCSKWPQSYLHAGIDLSPGCYQPLQRLHVAVLGRDEEGRCSVLPCGADAGGEEKRGKPRGPCCTHAPVLSQKRHSVHSASRVQRILACLLVCKGCLPGLLARVQKVLAVCWPACQLLCWPAGSCSCSW